MQQPWGYPQTASGFYVDGFYVNDISYTAASSSAALPSLPVASPAATRERSATEWLRDQIAEITVLAVA